MHTVYIPEWHPTPVNELLGNRFKASRLKKADREMLWAYTRGIPNAEGKRSLQLMIRLKKGQRACDPDAYNKSTNDALVHLNLLTDDNRQGVELLPVEFERGDAWGTRIALRDLP